MVYRVRFYCIVRCKLCRNIIEAVVCATNQEYSLIEINVYDPDTTQIVSDLSCK